MSTLLTRYMHKAPFELEAMGFLLPEVPNHPNRSEFRAVLTRLDEPSTRPPGGSAGHRVIVTRAAAEQALPSLIGMAVNCSDDFTDHAKRTKIGVITEAHIDGHDLVISGHLYEKDFFAEVNYIRANKAQMGASFEISDVSVADSAADIWQIDHLVFTGAALLLKDKAAYARTSVVARAEEEDTMSTEVLEKLQILGAKLDGLQSSMDAEADEDAARRDEEEASRHDAEAAAAAINAGRAREDNDEEDAARQDALAAGCHTKAFAARMKASQWHASQAAKSKEVGAADEATRHEAEAARLAATAEASQKAASDLQAALDAREAEAASASVDAADEAPMAAIVAAMMEAMQHGKVRREAEYPTKPVKPLKGMSDEMKARMFDVLQMMGMTFAPGNTMGKKKNAEVPHDDEAEDRALFRRMLRHDKGDKGMKASAPTDLHQARKLRDLQASVDLLTDAVTKITSLLTDSTHPRSGLITDSASRGPNGGAAPVRRSLQGTGGEQWADKYTGQRSTTGALPTEEEFTKTLIAKGITDTRDQMTHIVEARMAGHLA